MLTFSLFIFKGNNYFYFYKFKNFYILRNRENELFYFSVFLRMNFLFLTTFLHTFFKDLPAVIPFRQFVLSQNNSCFLIKKKLFLTARLVVSRTARSTEKFSQALGAASTNSPGAGTPTRRTPIRPGGDGSMTLSRTADCYWYVTREPSLRL